MTVTIISIVICVVAVVLLMHYRSVRKITADHKYEMDRLKTNFEKNRSQIIKRESGLNGYDFLNYNLHQSLIVQPGISINV